MAGDYLVMAATLINIKLRALLPAGEEEIEEESEELDDFASAKLLMQRLIEYRKFKEAARQLGQQAHRQSAIFLREVALPALSEAEAEPEIQGDLEALLKAFARVVQFAEQRGFHEIHGEDYTVEEKITLLRRRLLTSERLSMREVFEECRSKLEAIVTLMATLELCRQKELRVVQSESFDEIWVTGRREGDAADETAAAREAEAEAERLKAAEADILANRTGVVDDGVVEDDEDDLVGELEDGGEVGEAAEGEPGARVIAIGEGGVGGASGGASDGEAASGDRGESGDEDGAAERDS